MVTATTEKCLEALITNSLASNGWLPAASPKGLGDHNHESPEHQPKLANTQKNGRYKNGRLEQLPRGGERAG